MAEKRVRSIEWRRKHSVAMHRIVDKLLRMKKQKRMQFARPSQLRKRAHTLAKTILRKKVAGAAGSDYAKLSSAQKIAVDRLMSHIPAVATGKLAKKLMPIVIKHEKERVLQARKKHQINEGKKHSLLHHHARGQRHKVKRKLGSYNVATRGEGPDTKNKTASRASIQAMLKRMGRGSGNKTKYGERARQMMRSLLDKGSSHSKKIRKHSKLNAKRALHTDRSRKGHGYWSSAGKRDQGSKLISADVEVELFADMITEGTMKKFEALFLRGLVPTSKIEIYKRIFSDLDQNVKYRRYQEDITEMLEKLIKLITQDQTVYYRIRSTLQRRKDS